MGTGSIQSSQIQKRCQFWGAYNDHEENFYNYTRMTITRYLATGHFPSLQYEFKVGKSTASFIIHETFRAIWDVLKNVAMKKPTKEQRSNIAHVFWQRCIFTNCVRAIDWKHIWIIKPVASGY